MFADSDAVYVYRRLIIARAETQEHAAGQSAGFQPESAAVRAMSDKVRISHARKPAFGAERHLYRPVQRTVGHAVQQRIIQNFKCPFAVQRLNFFRANCGFACFGFILFFSDFRLLYAYDLQYDHQRAAQQTDRAFYCNFFPKENPAGQQTREDRA